MRIFAFDSGVGGLSVLPPILQKIPSAQISYLGDLAHLPYGTKSSQRVRELTVRNLRWLLKQHPLEAEDFGLIACNTASAEALDHCRESLGQEIPIVGVIEASCRAAVATKLQTVNVLATPGTVKSKAYEKNLRALGFTGLIQQIPCPLFVPLVEEKVFDGPALDWVIEKYLKGRVNKNDCVVLGCTHYPYLLNALQKHFPECRYVQAGSALARFDEIIEKTSQKKTPVVARASLDIYLTDSNVPAEQISFYLNRLGLSDIPWKCISIPPVD
jgi:glutamate racemase